MFAWLVIIVVIKQILGAPVVLLSYAASPFVSAFKYDRPLKAWGIMLFAMLSWSLGVTYYGGFLFQPRTQSPSTRYAIEPVRPLQTRQAVLRCCCSGVMEAADDPARDTFTRQVTLLRSLNERLAAKHGLHLLSRKKLLLTVSTTGQRPRLSDAYDTFCNRCPAPITAFPEDPNSALVALIHGSVRLPPSESR
jgi:hypothetical protein